MRSWLFVCWGATGCVYPATEPTGMELSWRWIEFNTIDGPETTKARTCAGAQTEQLAFEVHDRVDPSRYGIFRFDCEQGYQTLIDLQTEASDAFIRLHSGRYTVDVRAVDDANHAPQNESVADREVQIEDRGVTMVVWELTRRPVDWHLELSGAEACTSITLALNYAHPQLDLADDELDAEAIPPVYRRDLTSDRGLSVGGQAQRCSTQFNGLHQWADLDRGEYRLQITIDGTVCAVPVDLRAPMPAPMALDLASLQCDG